MRLQKKDNHLMIEIVFETIADVSSLWFTSMTAQTLYFILQTSTGSGSFLSHNITKYRILC